MKFSLVIFAPMTEMVTVVYLQCHTYIGPAARGFTPLRVDEYLNLVSALERSVWLLTAFWKR